MPSFAMYNSLVLLLLLIADSFVGALGVRSDVDMRHHVGSTAAVAASWYDTTANVIGSGAASCMSTPHAYYVFGNRCRRGISNDWESGCAYMEPNRSKHSRYDGIGFVGTTPNGPVRDILGGFVPGLSGGATVDHGQSICDQAIKWDVPDACVRAIAAEIGPLYDQERAWTFYKAVSPVYWFNSTMYRSTTCGKIQPPRWWVFRMSIFGKRKALCWDFLTDMHDLYCDATQNNHSTAPYAAICKHTRTSWGATNKQQKALMFQYLDDAAINNSGTPFLEPAARRDVDKAAAGLFGGNQDETKGIFNFFGWGLH